MLHNKMALRADFRGQLKQVAVAIIKTLLLTVKAPTTIFHRKWFEQETEL